MAEKLFKVNEVIEIGYQAPNKQTGQVVIAEIYLPNKEKDSSYPDVTLVEIGNTGTYRGSFTPDEVGEWQVITHLANGDGQVIKGYSVGAHNVHSVGESVTTVDGKVDIVSGKADVINTDMAKDSTVAKDSSVAKAAALAVVDGKVDNLDTEIDEANAKLNTVDTKLDDIDNKVSALDTPPMAF